MLELENRTLYPILDLQKTCALDSGLSEKLLGFDNTVQMWFYVLDSYSLLIMHRMVERNDF